MKTKFLATFIVGLAAGFGRFEFDLSTARADVDVSMNFQVGSRDDFYQPLSPYGSWVNLSYGRCWHPAHIEADWRPYGVGQWEWTDAGWYWESDEPWAWACYHYGSWVDDPSAGWCWIPGTEWAPSWVVWRDSPDYIGWAPCGPNRSVLPANFFVFVDAHHFHDRLRSRDLIVNNTTIINRTRVINDFHTENIQIGGSTRRIYANRGPGVDSIQRATGTRFTARPVTEVARQTPVPESIRNRTRPAEREQRPEIQGKTPDRTGRDQQRIYDQRQEQQQQQPRSSEKRQTPPPTERSPIVTEPQPRSNRQMAPTGRDEPRTHQTPPAAPPNRPEKVAPPVTPPERSVPQVPQERPMKPAGRERNMDNPPRGNAGPAMERPPAHPAPAKPEGPPADRGRGRDKDQQP